MLCDGTAVVESAQASGLALLAGNTLPLDATSHGTGELIRTATELGASAILLGVGGSATHDLGLGALATLGMDFLLRYRVTLNYARKQMALTLPRPPDKKDLPKPE